MNKRYVTQEKRESENNVCLANRRRENRSSSFDQIFSFTQISKSMRETELISSVSHQQIDCLTYLVQQCHIYIEHFGVVVKKVLWKTWPNLSKRTCRKKKKQVKLNNDKVNCFLVEEIVDIEGRRRWKM